jgi:glycosyltransferase involved in cell wall biosynthesis
VEDHVILPGFVPDDELPALYAAADVFAFPSLLEGFGLPPVEAMACGAPVAASRAGPMPEVLGAAARYFDPSDTGDMASTLVELLESEERRAACREAGYERAARYSWEHTANATLEVYEATARAPG